MRIWVIVRTSCPNLQIGHYYFAHSAQSEFRSTPKNLQFALSLSVSVSVTDTRCRGNLQLQSVILQNTGMGKERIRGNVSPCSGSSGRSCQEAFPEVPIAISFWTRQYRSTPQSAQRYTHKILISRVIASRAQECFFFFWWCRQLTFFESFGFRQDKNQVTITLQTIATEKITRSSQ